MKGILKSDEVDRLLEELEQTRTQTAANVKTKYKQIFARNRQIMQDTNAKIRQLCIMLKENVRHFEDEGVLSV